MIELSNYPNLAIIGMAVKGNRFENIEALGFQVFHGRDHLIPHSQDPITDHDLQYLIEKIILETCSDCKNIGIITFQPQLVDKIRRLDTGQAIKFHFDQKESFVSAWSATSEWLRNKEVDAVLILEENQHNKTLFAVLLSTEMYATETGKHFLATISGASLQPRTKVKPSMQELIQSSLKLGKIHPDEIGLLLMSSSLEIAPEMNVPQELIAPLQSTNGRTCALSGGHGGLQSIIKAVWCLNHRLIPGTKNWIAPADPGVWLESSFYIPTESRTWFAPVDNSARAAMMINATAQGFDGVFILCEGNRKSKSGHSALKLEPLLLFPIGGRTPQELLDSLSRLQEEIDTVSNLRMLSTQKMMRYHGRRRPDNFIACILGETSDDIIRETQFALKGIPAAFTKNADWRTPKGSYFTPVPLGDSGTVSFVYPGAFNSYPGAAQDIFYLFPALYDRLEEVSKNFSDLMNEKILYPRKISALSPSDVLDAEKKLVADPLAMLASGISLSTMFTHLLRDIFGVHPISAFGYSLGEISMLFANGVWTQVDEASVALRASPLFHTRLAGPQNAVREKWNLPAAHPSVAGEAIWENYILMSSPVAVKDALKDENRVFMTHINTPNQVVIGGDPAACHRVIAVLQCNSLQAPFNYTLHCEAMQSEFYELQRLLSWPVSDPSEMKFYAAASYQAIPITQKTIAEQIAYDLCHQLDFPRLVNQAFSDGARIFIELGAGANCTRWVAETLKDKPHAAFSTNRKGLNDHAAVCQLLAKLISQRVPVTLSTFTM